MTLRATPSSFQDAALNTSLRASLAPGELLDGKYRIDAHIAEGGMGMVLRATHLDLDCPVAIKVIRPEHSENEDVIARLLAEARIAAGLRSKHVNRVLDVGRIDTGLPYLVLEHLEGSDLSGYLERRGRLPISEAVDWVMQACEGLAEAHAFGIVHRDLKPENLFLSEEADGGFVLKVLDFGISKAPASRRGGRSLTNPFEVVGSPSYMSPEQVRGGNVDERADIWALGTLLHELISGDEPFAAESISDTFMLILDEHHLLAPLPGGPASEQVEAVIRKCIQRNADLRYQNVVELAAALAPLGTDPLQARRVARVAAASHARVIATGDTLTLANPGTPLALSTHNDVVQLDETPFEPRGGARKWLISAGALLAMAVGTVLLLGARPSVTAGRSVDAAVPAVVPAPVAAANFAESAPLVTVVDVAPAPSAHATAAERTLVLAPPKQLTTSWPPPRAEPPWPPAAMPEVTAREAEPPPPKQPPPSPTLDAWDPKTFGGRR